MGCTSPDDPADGAARLPTRKDIDMINLIDWILDLFRSEDAARAIDRRALPVVDRKAR